MKLLLFAGTTEGRLLTKRLVGMPGADVTVCVATRYGREMLGDIPEHFTVMAERLTQDEMADLMRSGAFELVVDATHPYAAVVTQNIRAAAQAAGAAVMRLLRTEGAAQDGHYYASVQDAADALTKTTGNVLITTGSKELEAYISVPGYAGRLYPRVLPTLESIGKCKKLGFGHSHIIAMQGPFSVDLNKAIMEQFDIRIMVTKDGGDTGGFAQKMEAALAQSVEVLIVGRPTHESGSTFDEVVAEIQRRMEG